MKVKICGIKNENEANVLNETMPDFCGFVFAKSKREISIEKALVLKKILNPKIKTVGVFVEEDFEKIKNIKNQGIIDFAQLHFEAEEQFILKLKNERIKTIKVIKQKENKYNIETIADFILFDTYSPKTAGGTNKTFDWNIEIKSNVPYFIAGGLNCENIKEMAEKLKPYGVDVSSGAEVDGFKTKEKVLGIINATKELNL